MGSANFVRRRLRSRRRHPTVSTWAGADNWKSGNPEPSGAHRDECHRFNGLLRYDRTILQHRAESVTVEVPFWNSPGLNGHHDGSVRDSERKIIGRPIGMLDGE